MGSVFSSNLARFVDTGVNVGVAIGVSTGEGAGVEVGLGVGRGGSPKTRLTGAETESRTTASSRIMTSEMSFFTDIYGS
jgi:tetrahydrodipicolinate N-succinyltransferase